MTRMPSAIASAPRRSAATAKVNVMRGGKEQTANIALVTAPDTPREEIVIQSRSPFAGVKVGNLSPALADELRLDPGAEGVAILDVANGSLAQRFGFRRGDVVVSVNDKPIQKTRDLDQATKQESPRPGGSS